MHRKETVVLEFDTELGHYQIVDMTYEGRPARVLFSGDHDAAQSGVAHDEQTDLLFDYNQRFMELLSGMYPKRVLIIGGGAFSLPMALITALPKVQVDVVELDPKLATIAEQYFGLQPNKRLTIIHGDGREYLQRKGPAYDAIIIDAFTHTVMPRELITVEAVQAMKKRLTKNGIVAVNVISAYYGRRGESLRRVYAAYHHEFQAIGIYPASRSLLSAWLPQNYVLVAHKAELQPVHIRFDAMPDLEIDQVEAFRD